MAYIANYGSVILSVNRALLGAVSPSLRSVQVEYADNEINIYCFFDGAISEDDSEDMSAAASEVAASFPNHKVYEHCIRADYPTPIKPTDKARHTVFWRKEG
ncbi:MAG: hypothetical protein ACLPSF_02220 [Methylocella sp.]